MISTNLFEHVADHSLRLALITRDPSLADLARSQTFSAWWNDNNEGDRVAESLTSRVYSIRENAIMAMGEDSTPEAFWDALTTYWSN